MPLARRAGHALGVAALAMLAACVQVPRPAPLDVGAYWPTYLGNAARAPFLGQRISAEPPSALWSASLSAAIRGVPVVTDEAVIAASSDRYIQALSREDGSVLWRRRLDGPPVAPLISAGRIFTATEDKGRLRVLELTEGDDVWKRRLPSTARSLALAGDTVYAVTDDASLYALIDDEEPLWRVGLPRAASASPLVVGPWVICVAFDSLFVFDGQSGARRAAAGGRGIVIGEAASDGQVVYTATEGGSLQAHRLPELEPLWRAHGFEGFLAGPVLADEHGYAVTRFGHVVRFALDDGSARVVFRSGGIVIAAPTLVQNGLLVGTLAGKLHFMTRDGRPIWSVRWEGSIESPVLVHEGRLLVTLQRQSTGLLSSGWQAQIIELR